MILSHKTVYRSYQLIIIFMSRPIHELIQAMACTVFGVIIGLYII